MIPDELRGNVIDLEGHELVAVELGHTDTDHTTCLHVPSIGLVVAGASGTRSEFNGDFVWSDYVTQKGYAYVSQNKGTLNLTVSNAANSMACRLSPSSTAG